MSGFLTGVWRFLGKPTEAPAVNKKTINIKWSTIEHGGHKADLFYVGAASPRRRVLILPGNPGSAEWYTAFAARICENSKHKDVGVFGISYLGHGLRSIIPESKFGVEDQVRLVQTVVSSVSPDVLVGHSFGAHVGIQIMKRDESMRRKARLVLLMPLTYCADRVSARIRFMMRPSFQAVGPDFVALWTGVVPRALRRALGRREGANEHCMSVIDKCIGCRPLFRNILSLVEDECRQVRGLDFALLAKMAGRIMYYHVDNDIWDPDTAFEEFREKLPNERFVDNRSGVKHAFVLNDGWVEDVSKAVSDFLD